MTLSCSLCRHWNKRNHNFHSAAWFYWQKPTSLQLRDWQFSCMAIWKHFFQPSHQLFTHTCMSLKLLVTNLRLHLHEWRPCRAVRLHLNCQIYCQAKCKRTTVHWMELIAVQVALYNIYTVHDDIVYDNKYILDILWGPTVCWQWYQETYGNHWMNGVI